MKSALRRGVLSEKRFLQLMSPLANRHPEVFFKAAARAVIFEIGKENATHRVVLMNKKAEIATSKVEEETEKVQFVIREIFQHLIVSFVNMQRLLISHTTRKKKNKKKRRKKNSELTIEDIDIMTTGKLLKMLAHLFKRFPLCMKSIRDLVVMCPKSGENFTVRIQYHSNIRDVTD